MDEKAMDVSQALKDTENSLRDFIAYVLREAFGDEWVDKCGVTPERVQKWNDRKAEEERRQKLGAVEERLLYYADFYDLGTILGEHWHKFSEALGDKKRFMVFPQEMRRQRDPHAHRRELLPHQKHLSLGIAGDIRTRIVRYRSKRETSEDYYPRIESARDSLGNIYALGKSVSLNTGYRLRVGDCLEFVIAATDPLGEPLEYRLNVGGIVTIPWQGSHSMQLTIAERHVQKRLAVVLQVRSQREYHAKTHYDDRVIFNYEVLPPRPDTA